MLITLENTIHMNLSSSACDSSGPVLLSPLRTRHWLKVAPLNPLVNQPRLAPDGDPPVVPAPMAHRTTQQLKLELVIHLECNTETRHHDLVRETPPDIGPEPQHDTTDRTAASDTSIAITSTSVACSGKAAELAGDDRATSRRWRRERLAEIGAALRQISEEFAADRRRPDECRTEPRRRLF